MIDRETLEVVFTWAAGGAAAINAYGIRDAWKTLSALRASDRADDENAYLLAKGGIRAACIRTIQMVCLLIVAYIAGTVEPRPAVSGVLSITWQLLTFVGLLSVIKELLAMRDRRRVVVAATVSPFGAPRR